MAAAVGRGARVDRSMFGPADVGAASDAGPAPNGHQVVGVEVDDAELSPVGAARQAILEHDLGISRTCVELGPSPRRNRTGQVLLATAGRRP